MTNEAITTALNKLISGNPDELGAYFLNVCQNENIDSTLSDLQIYMLRLDGNNRPRVNDLVDWLACCIIDYCIPQKEIREAKEKDEKYHTSENTVRLNKKAKDLFTNLSNTGEGGELLLSVMMQRILKIPQLLCKMPLKTNSDIHYHGADGLYGEYDETTQKFHLYWGESKIYNNFDQALGDCLDSIKYLLVEEGVTGARRSRDIELFRDNIDFDNTHLEEAILQFLNPNSEKFLRLEYRGACLIGYNELAYPKDMSKVEQEIFIPIKGKIENIKDKIARQLQKRTPLDLFHMQIFVVPFSDVDEFRKRFLERI